MSFKCKGSVEVTQLSPVLSFFTSCVGEVLCNILITPWLYNIVPCAI